MTLLFLDTETTGLNCSTDRVVQLGARLQLGQQTVDFNSYIQPEGFTIPLEAFQIHGITTEFAQTNGLPLVEVLDALELLLSLADAIVGHWIKYDVAILTAEANRAGRDSLASIISSKQQICTKHLSRQYLERIGESPDRTATKLETMFLRLTKEPLTDAHDAFTDVLACERIHQELIAA